MTLFLAVSQGEKKAKNVDDLFLYMQKAYLKYTLAETVGVIDEE